MFTSEPYHLELNVLQFWDNIFSNRWSVLERELVEGSTKYLRRDEKGAGAEEGMKKTFTVFQMAGEKQSFPPFAEVYVGSLWSHYAQQIGRGQSQHCNNP